MDNNWLSLCRFHVGIEFRCSKTPGTSKRPSPNLHTSDTKGYKAEVESAMEKNGEARSHLEGHQMHCLRQGAERLSRGGPCYWKFSNARSRVRSKVSYQSSPAKISPSTNSISCRKAPMSKPFSHREPVPAIKSPTAQVLRGIEGMELRERTSVRTIDIACMRLRYGSRNLCNL